ncbi:MAG TPA: DUF2076 domain-containing protein [Stellaceae bacterium]|jgi:hypothetical protein|nr:DUF2076 domain-containing protein [Stellaceae bacterium]
MTPQEKDLLTTLLARLKSASSQPKDPEADTLIRQALAEQPDMPYYLVQTVLIQDLSLHQAQQRIADLEKQLADAQQAARPSATSFLGGLFGSRPSAPPAGPPPAGPWTRSPQVAGAPPPQPYGQPGGYAQPGYGQPPSGGFMGAGMGGGSGFLRSAAATAAGVAGGALLFQGIESLFGPHYAGGLTGGAGMTPGLGETVVNNYYGSDAGGSDWSSDAGAAAGGGDWSSDPGAAGGGGDWSSDAGGGDWSSDQDMGGGDWSSGDSNTSC